jgi:putative endonuclease
VRGFLRAGAGAIVSRMTRAKDAVGAYGERVAVRYLIDQGMVVLDRNWRCGVGELDAVLRDGDTLVFAEVKTRRGGRFGIPAEAVVPAKVTRLRRLAALWLAQSTLRPREVRFDVVSVLPQATGPATVEHLRGAF